MISLHASSCISAAIADQGPDVVQWPMLHLSARIWGLFAVAQELKAYSFDTCGFEHVHHIGDSRAVSQATFSDEYQRAHTIDGTVFVAQPDTGMPQSVDTARRLGRRSPCLA